MPNQDKINNVTEEITSIIDEAKLQIAQDLLKLKESVTPDEFIEVLDKMDLKGILDAKIAKAKQLYINHHRVVLADTIPFGELNGS